MANGFVKQYVPTIAGDAVPVQHLCGWGVWHGPEQFDHDATTRVLRENFDLWSTEPVGQVIYRQLRIVGAEPYKPGQRSMLWEVGRKLLGDDPLNYAQGVGDCHEAGTQVLMGDGSTKNIEDVRVGDMVVTHTGKICRVLRTIQKPYTGTMYTMRAKGHYATITSTADHRFVAYGRHTMDAYDWRPISDLKPKIDSVLVPYGIRHVEYVYVEYDGQRILVDEDFAEIFGWYLAEGGVSSRTLADGTISHQKVTFNLGADEAHVASRLIDLLDSVFGVEGVSQYHKTDKGSLLVEVYNVKFATFMKDLVPGNVYSKRVPTLFLRSPAAVKMSLLRAWIDGDGHLSPKAVMAEACTVSHGMLADFYHLAVSLGLSPNIQYSKQYSHQTRRAGRMAFRGTSGCKVMDVDLPNRDHARFGNLGLIRKVKTLVAKDVVDEEVYCLEVEHDHSFIANGYAVSNCVSFGAKNAIEYVQFYPIANGTRDEWTMVFPPYLWGMGRLAPDCGNNQLGDEDGSLGAWQSKAAMKYGAIPLKYDGVPEYSGAVARQWGNQPGPNSRWIELGKQHIVRSTALVKTWEDLVQALVNGYPVTVASSAGFEMMVRADGFHHRGQDWGHQTCFIGVDDDPSDPYAIDLNSWGCFSDDMEILTEMGWMKFDDLPQGLAVATLNPLTHHLEYQVPTAYHQYPYHGELYNFVGRDINQLVTPNHRIYHRPIHSPSWRMSEAQELGHMCHMKKDCDWDGEEVDTYTIGDRVVRMDDWLEFLGYFLSEGHTYRAFRRVPATVGGGMRSNGSSRRVGISQHKPAHMDVMGACVDRIPFKSHRTRNGWVFSNRMLYEELKPLGKSHEKFIPSYVKNLSRRQQRILFDAMMRGDGSYSKCRTGERATYYTSSKQLADDFQELLLKIGYAGDISWTDRIGREMSNGVTRHREYRVGIKRFELTPKRSSPGWVPILIPYDGDVYCVTVPNGIVYVRRNGKACWSGNSVHGDLKDFKTGEPLPKGVLRLRKADVLEMLGEGDSFAYSSFDGFPSQDIDRDKFNLW